MRIIPTLLFSLLTIGLVTLVVMQQLQGNLNFIFGSPPLKIGENVYDFDPQEVGRIHVVNDDGTKATIIKKGVAWVLEEPWEDYADSRVIRSVIDFASRLQIEDVIKRDDVEDLEKFGLRDSSIELELFDKSGAPLCHFKMGRYTAWRGFDPNLKSEDPTKAVPSFPTLVIRPSEEGLKDHLYICSDFANPALRSIPIRDFFGGGLQLFRDHQLFYLSPAAAAEITLKEKNSEITLQRPSLDKEADWVITKPFELAANPENLDQLLSGLSRITALQVLDENAINLPEPLPENIDHSISLRYFLPNGNLSQPITAIFYPSENEQATTAPVVILEGDGKKRAAILMIPQGTGSLLADLPRSVNDLRNRSMTSLQVKQIQSVAVSDFTGRSVTLNLEFDPHELARRWQARVIAAEATNNPNDSYYGPANEFQVTRLFEALFKDEVESFTNDASTDPKAYGLDDGGHPLEISEAAYNAALKNIPHRELNVVSQAPTPDTPAPTGLDIFGLDKPKVVTRGDIVLHLGLVKLRHFFANRLDENGKETPHVVEIPADSLNKMSLDPHPWRSVRLWNINRFEIQALIIQKKEQAPLELTYEFFSEVWEATQQGKNVSAFLNTNKASKFIKKLTDIEVQHWFGPVADNAAFRLTDPDLKISVLIEDIDEDGIVKGQAPQLSMARPMASTTER